MPCLSFCIYFGRFRYSWLKLNNRWLLQEFKEVGDLPILMPIKASFTSIPRSKDSLFSLRKGCTIFVFVFINIFVDCSPKVNAKWERVECNNSTFKMGPEKS